MKSFVLIHALLILVFGLTLWVYSASFAASFALGGFLTLGNVGALYLAWDRIFRKKNVALAISVIVFKYAILIFIIFEVTRSTFWSGLWFGLGFAVVGLTSLLWAWFKSKSIKETVSG